MKTNQASSLAPARIAVMPWNRSVTLTHPWIAISQLFVRCSSYSILHFLKDMPSSSIHRNPHLRDQLLRLVLLRRLPRPHALVRLAHLRIKFKI